MMQTLSVALNERSYPIFIGENLLGQSQCYTPYLQGKQVLVVSNQTVAPLYLAAVEQVLRAEGYQVASQGPCGTAVLALGVFLGAGDSPSVRPRIRR